MSETQKFKVKKNLTMPVVKLLLDKPVYIRVEEPMKIGKKVDDKKDEAVLMTVVNLESGEIGQLLVPSVMQGILHDEYGAPKYGTEKDENGVSHTVEVLPGTHKYVGLGFAITRHPKPKGKSYNAMSIQEIELGEEAIA